MAIVRGPLFSLDARGVIGDAMVFGGWKGIPWVREQFIPQNPKTVGQVNARTIFTQSVTRWQQLDAAKKAEWETAIQRKGYTMSGFNFFVSEYCKDMHNGETPSDDPPL